MKKGVKSIYICIRNDIPHPLELRDRRIYTRFYLKTGGGGGSGVVVKRGGGETRPSCP